MLKSKFLQIYSYVCYKQSIFEVNLEDIVHSL